MLKEMGLALMDLLDAHFNKIEFYEGQFENLDEQVIKPPHAYLEYMSGTGSETDEVLETVDLSLHVMTSRVSRSASDMLQKVEDVIKTVHQAGLRYDDQYIGRVFYKGFKNSTTFQGLVIWEVALQVKR